MDRRREARIEARSAFFDLETPTGIVACQVVNLSRLGLGIELPPSLDEMAFAELIRDAQLQGVLRIAGEALPAHVVVRTRKGSFLGLEYTNQSLEFMNQLRTLLSPSYVASSIHAIAPEFLAPDIEAAYRGDDFECVVFKSGKSAVRNMVQIYTEGQVIELVGAHARFVPPPMVRRSVKREGASVDFLTEVASLADEGTTDELQSVYQKVRKVFSFWKDCPPELLILIESQQAEV